ncbi:Acid proteases protein [Dioscorea alata]|uniref:Acid proteases protein n=1 Tax=Dioscorea alata TaxID=55571 RepID=A0ACB7VQ65_DIOAL|nr:Acid proteases protein [Dioscorea alata]
MAEMMVKLQQLDRTSPSLTPASAQPPLLPLPASFAPSIHSSTHTQTLNSHPPTRPPKTEVPIFTGDDVLGWLFQINHYFFFNQIPDNQRVSIAAFYMGGTALHWFQWLQAKAQLSHWEDFARKIELRFGPSSFINHEASLLKLKQMTAIDAYLHEFECLSTRVTGLSQSSLLNCFLSGLKDEIQRELYILKPEDLHDAVGMAKLVEDKINASRPPAQRPVFPRQAGPMHPPVIARPTPLPIKRLTPTEMAARWAKGLCFNCDSQFTRGHRCKPALFFCLMVEQDDGDHLDDDPSLEQQTSSAEDLGELIPVESVPCISFNALMGQIVPSTLKLAGSINGKEIIVLVDGGSTNNFIQSRLATHLNLVLQPSSHLRVTVGNGDALTCGGECPGPAQA